RETFAECFSKCPNRGEDPPRVFSKSASRACPEAGLPVAVCPFYRACLDDRQYVVGCQGIRPVRLRISRYRGYTEGRMTAYLLLFLAALGAGLMNAVAG